MRNIDHFIAGATYASGGRHGDVFDPNNGGVQAKVRFGTAADLDRAVAAMVGDDRDVLLAGATVHDRGGGLFGGDGGIKRSE